MSGQPANGHRPGSTTTSFILSAGSVVAVVLLLVAFAQRALGNREPSDFFAILGVTILLATPALGLVTTFFELRRVQRTAALLALLVLVVLVGATAFALIGR